MESTMSNLIVKYLQPLSGFLILAGIVACGIQLIVNAYRPKERSQAMSSLLWVGIGGIILGLITTITSLFLRMSGLIVGGVSPIAGANQGQSLSTVVDDKTGFISGIFSTFLDELSGALSSVANSLTELLYGTPVSTDGTFEIGHVLLASSDKWFPQSTLNVMYALTTLIAFGVVPIMFIAISKVGVKLTLSPINTNLRKDVSDDVSRWFLSLVLIGVAPLFVTANIQLNGALVEYLKGIITTNGAQGSLGLGDIQTGSQVLTSLVKLTFSCMSFYIIALFEVRKLMIMIFTVFTPIAAILWAMNKKRNGCTNMDR